MLTNQNDPAVAAPFCASVRTSQTFSSRRASARFSGTRASQRLPRAWAKRPRMTFFLWARITNVDESRSFLRLSRRRLRPHRDKGFPFGHWKRLRVHCGLAAGAHAHLTVIPPISLVKRFSSAGRVLDDSLPVPSMEGLSFIASCSDLNGEFALGDAGGDTGNGHAAEKKSAWRAHRTPRQASQDTSSKPPATPPPAECTRTSRPPRSPAIDKQHP
jgi:hypothetical protein